MKACSTFDSLASIAIIIINRSVVAVVVVLVLSFEGHEIDEERCGEQRCLEFHVEVHGESDGEIVRRCTTLLTTTRPQFAHRSDLIAAGENLEEVLF